MKKFLISHIILIGYIITSGTYLLIRGQFVSDTICINELRCLVIGFVSYGVFDLIKYIFKNK